MDFVAPPLWDHQKLTISRARGLPGFALLMAMGVGKTRTVIDILRERCGEEGRLLRTLILSPIITLPNWKEELRKFSKIPPGDVLILGGPGKQRLKMLQDVQGQEKILITGYETLLMPDVYLALQTWGVECLIADEVHRCKDPKTKRTKLAIQLANGLRARSGMQVIPPIRYRYILTGTPVLNSPMDLFSQFQILDGGATFGSNFYTFRANYFYDKNAGMPGQKYFPDWRLRDGALAKISEKIAPVSMRVEKKDCMDLPPLIRQTISVAMSPEQAKLYREMKKDLITFLGTHVVSAALAMTKALRLQQITSGFVKTSEDREISLKNTPKEAALRELLEDLTPHSKVIIWAVWKENYAQIRKLLDDLKLDYAEVHGEISSPDKFENVRKFNEDASCRVFLGHPGSGGIGINLVSAPYSIFYSRTFSLEQSLQAEARNHRGGSEIHSKITRYDLVCKDTIDELVQKVLADKQEVSEAILKSEILKALSLPEPEPETAE